jgi:hypothetical protein
MASHGGELLSDEDFRQATDEQLSSLVTKLDLVLRRRGMVGIDWRESHGLEPPDPADPTDS